MALVFDHSEMEPIGRLVLLALADHCDHEGYAWPSVERLAQKCGLSRRTVQRALNDCEQAGELIRVIGGRGRRSTTQYRIVLHGAVDNSLLGRHSDALTDPLRASETTLRASESARKGVTVVTQTIRNRQEPRPSLQDVVDNPDPDVVARVAEVREGLKAPHRKGSET
jgi:hypothetical protein